MSQLFTERPWQKPMIEIATRLDRCNIFAKPGTGKSSATLMALEIRNTVDNAYPALVIGPKRVANSVWSSEVEKWAQFNHLRVARILGTQAARVAALNSKADIYTIHYGLLKWLVETLDGKWPFRTVIADESSRLKNTRAHFKRLKSGKLKLYVQGGSINAGYLARNALRTRFWTNLTGTPASNGLQNLYGQQWFVDYGAALGNSYSAFTNRWFYQRRGTSAEQAVFEPFDHAFDEITERIKPNTVSLDPRDWFDIQEPREVNIMVDLPEKLMKQYREFHREAVLKLSEEKYITAVNAGVLTGKCAAAGTPVLTSKGWKPIEQVLPADLVWDGVAFVNHGGVADNGMQKVVECFGVWMTPDHKVLTTVGWKEASEINGNASNRYDRAKARLPDGYQESQRPNTRTTQVGVSLCVRSEGNKGWTRASTQKEQPGNILRMQAQGATVEAETDARDDQAPSFFCLAFYAQALSKYSTPVLASLRRSRNQGVQAVEHFREFLERLRANLAERFKSGSNQQRQRVFAVELPMGNSVSAASQHNENTPGRHPSWADVPERSSTTLRTEIDHAQVPARQRMDRGEIAQVYDIINCGPRHRFVVQDRDGEPLIIHNCLQFANGHMFDEKRIAHHIHDEKLDALDSLIENLNGAPLLLCYQYIPDREAILKRFPFARLLPSDHRQKSVEDEWNTGRIPLLVVHPASAGHGLSLQHGGCDIAFFGTGWDAELYEQVIERLGPMRQMQSGYDRVVNVYRLLVRGTYDMRAADTVAGKISLQDAVMEAVR